MKPGPDMRPVAVPDDGRALDQRVAKQDKQKDMANHEVVNPGGPVDHIVLKALSHPESGDIHINENLFAIGRNEAPFDTYPPELVADLSRRHARIFSEYGGVYLADLDSKNGTAVNGVNMQHQISKLKNGDEICFGRSLSYRVQLDTRVQTLQPQHAEKLLCLTLNPESNDARHDAGLQPIVVTQFPFLISKADEIFARYKDTQPHQVNYLSRRHAHIFLKGGAPFVEDLGSTNGTFVNGKRLDEHAVALRDDDVIAFGGYHFVYKAHLQKEQIEVDPTMTQMSPPNANTAALAGDDDKTTFVAAAGSFLDIFCVDHAPQQDDEANSEVQQANEALSKDANKKKPRGKYATLWSGLTQVFAGSERTNFRHGLRWVAAVTASFGVLALFLYFRDAPERNLNALLVDGDYARAVTLASRYLQQDPDNTHIKALGSEALLKANVPNWLAQLKAHDFARASATLAGMKQLSLNNADILALTGELEWIGSLEQFVMGRGGVDAPIRVYTDEEKIKTLLARWNDDTQGHQRALDTIASTVPQFKDPYADVLSHLRKLQSDDAVYLPAIERLKTTISKELNNDHPEAVEAALKETAEKYPRIGGLENMRQDLRQYMAIDNAARSQDQSALIALVANAHFSTPLFQARLNGLKSDSRFPPADVIGQYQAATRAWRAGDTQNAYAGLEKMAAGAGGSASAWADAAAKQLAHKKAIAEQFAALQKMRGEKDKYKEKDKDYEERLLSFYGSLDSDDDVYFIKATEADIAQYKNKAIERAQKYLSHAQELWQKYRENGGIEGAQRLDAAVTNQFKAQAHLLSEAYDSAQQGTRIYPQLKSESPAESRKLQDDINTEVGQQRKALLDLRNVLTPALFKAKLALFPKEEKTE